MSKHAATKCEHELVSQHGEMAARQASLFRSASALVMYARRELLLSLPLLEIASVPIGDGFLVQQRGRHRRLAMPAARADDDASQRPSHT